MTGSLFDDLDAPDPGPLTDGDGADRTARPAGRARRSRSRAPLAVRMRPRRLDEIVGQQHLLKPGSPLQVLAGEDRGPAGPSSIILWGPPGTGKTTLMAQWAAASGLPVAWCRLDAGATGRLVPLLVPHWPAGPTRSPHWWCRR